MELTLRVIRSIHNGFAEYLCCESRNRLVCCWNARLHRRVRSLASGNECRGRNRIGWKRCYNLLDGYEGLPLARQIDG